MRTKAVHSHRPFAHPRHNTHLFGIEPGMIVADLGAGSGHYTFEIAERLQNAGRVYAVDVQRDLLRRIRNEALRRGYKTVGVVAGDIEKPHGTRLADHSLDLALMSNTLFQLEHPDGALEEAWRILKPHGTLVLIDWLDSFRHLGPHPRHVVTRDMALALAREHGLEFLSSFDAGAHHWGMCLKPKARNV